MLRITDDESDEGSVDSFPDQQIHTSSQKVDIPTPFEIVVRSQLLMGRTQFLIPWWSKLAAR